MNIENNPLLRKELTNIIQNKINIKKGIASFFKRFPHSIELVEERIDNNGSSWRYNCYIYAFGLRQESIKTEFILNDIIPNSKFIQYLIENYLSETTLDYVQNGGYVIYFGNNGPKHAGRIEKNKIISKWGTCDLLSHGLFEVPSDYGNAVKFYKQMSEDRIFEIFNQWAQVELNKQLLNIN